jgi:hypothetical protein
VLASFRPKRIRIEEVGDPRLGSDAGRIPLKWRLDRILVQATVAIDSGELVSLDDAGLLAKLELRHVALLDEHGIDHLDISAIRSSKRIVTQTISQSLYEDGAVGIVYGSNLDDLRCLALFEGRAHLEPTGVSVSLGSPIPELLQVCEEWGLTLDP